MDLPAPHAATDLSYLQSIPGDNNRPHSDRSRSRGSPRSASGARSVASVTNRSHLRSEARGGGPVSRLRSKRKTSIFERSSLEHFAGPVRAQSTFAPKDDASTFVRFLYKTANWVCFVPLLFKYYLTAPGRVAETLELVSAYTMFWLLPYLAGFGDASTFSWVYIWSYIADFLMIMVKLHAIFHRRLRFIGLLANMQWLQTRMRAKTAAKSELDPDSRHTSFAVGATRGGRSRDNRDARSNSSRQGLSRFELFLLLSLVPYEVPLWFFEAQRWLVPIVRLARFGYLLPKANQAMAFLEMSQALPYAVSRLVRVFHVFFWCTHILGTQRSHRLNFDLSQADKDLVRPSLSPLP